MQTKFSRRILSAVVAASMSLSMFSFEAFADDSELIINDPPISKITEDFNDVGGVPYSLNMHSKKEIQDKFFALGMDDRFSTTYDKKYSLTAPYDAGKLSSATLQQALNTVNFVRYVAGLDSVSLNENYNTYTQYASLVNAVNGSLSHQPSKPSGMSDDMYSLGLKGASSSNIGYGYGTIPDSIIRGYMEDTDSNNIDRLGHRRWLINPSMQQIGFGMVSSYTATYAFDNAFGGYLADDYIAWPPKYMPYEIYKPSSTGYAFSVNLGVDYDTPSLDNVTVQVTSKLQGKTWKLDKSCTNKNGIYLNVNNDGYGMKKCIIFNVGSFSNYDEVTVKINGIYKGGVSSPITYTVNFFSVLDTVEEDTVNAPSKVTATPGNGKVTLSWSKVTGATKYRIQRCVGNSTTWSTIANPTGTSYVDTNVTNGTTYKYRIFTYAGTSRSNASSVVSATPVGSIGKSTLSASAGNGEVNLSWTSVAGATKYRIQRCVGNSTTWSTIAYASGTSYKDTNVTNGTSYSYRIYAYAGSARGAASNTVTVKPNSSAIGTPTLSGTAGNGKVTLSWTKVAGATKYRIQRCAANSTTWSTIAYPTGTSYVDIDVTNGRSYKYRIYAYVGSARGAASNVVTATPSSSSIGTPTLSASAGNGKVTLSWTKVAGATKYRIQRCAANSTTWSTIAYPTGTSYVDTDVTNGKSYKYRIYAYVGSARGEASNVVIATPSSSSIGTPTLSASAGNGKVTLSWTKVTGATKYMLQRCSEKFTTWITIAYPTGTSYIDIDVTNGITYKYRICAISGSVIGDSSNVVTATPKSGALSAPVLTYLTGIGKVHLSWSKISGATHYRIQRCEDGSDSWTTIKETSSLKYTDTAVIAGQKYKYRVFACVENEVGNPSNVITVTVGK